MPMRSLLFNFIIINVIIMMLLLQYASRCLNAEFAAYHEERPHPSLQLCSSV